MKKYLVFEDMLVNIMAEEDVRANWKEKLGITAKYQATHKDPIVTIFEVIDERKAVKYYNHSKVRMMNEEDVKKLVDELNKDFLEYMLTDSAALQVDLMLSKKTEVEGYDASKPITCQENLKVLYDVGLGGIIKRKKPTID